MIIMPKRLQELMDELKISNAETYYHSIHVKGYVYNMIKNMNLSGFTAYSKSEIDAICKGALLHDVGKLYVKNLILTKDTHLTDEEKKRMTEHTKFGFEAVKSCLTEEEYEIIKNICLYHHERCDGKGYEGKKDLPIYVHAVAICDAFDALTTERIYRTALDSDKAIAMIENGDCGAFDSEIVKYLKQITE